MICDCVTICNHAKESFLSEPVSGTKRKESNLLGAIAQLHIFCDVIGVYTSYCAAGFYISNLEPYKETTQKLVQLFHIIQAFPNI